MEIKEKFSKYRKSDGYGGYSGYKNFDQKKSYQKQLDRQKEQYHDVNSTIHESELGLELELLEETLNLKIEN